MSHTKGPLSLEFDGDGALIEGIIRVPNVYQEWREDAQVLAAAPDLLAACEEALKELEYHNWQNTRTYNLIQAAIAKAKGESR